MSVMNPWSRHYQIVWEHRAADHTLPLWLRVACLAYGRHEANGHANFRRGDLSWILGTPPTGDEPFKRRHKTTVRNAIKTAVEHDWLADGSCTECLIVPGHAIAGGLGSESKPCLVHERKNPQKRSESERLTLVS